MPERTSPPDLTTRSHHLHIGLGKLGLGLVLECLRQDRPLIILQREGESWPKARFERFIGKRVVLVNKKNGAKGKQEGDIKRTVEVLYNSTEAEAKIGTSGPSCSFLVFYDRDCLSSLGWLLNHVASVTISVGDKDAQKQFASWVDKSANRGSTLVYPFENVIAEDLKHSEVIRQVIPDRVCGEDITDNSSPDTISISVEPYRRVVIWAEQQEVSDTFNDCVEAVQSKGLFTYYHDVKRRLVNALHFYLAVLCYAHFESKDLPLDQWSDQYLFFLMGEIMQRSSKSRLCIDALIGAQAMRTVIESGKLLEAERDYIRKGREKEETYQKEEEEAYLRLVDYAQGSLARFQVARDQLSRICNFLDPHKIKEKQSEHLDELQMFFTLSRSEIDHFKVRLRPWTNEIHLAIKHVEKCSNDIDTAQIESLKVQLEALRSKEAKP